MYLLSKSANLDLLNKQVTKIHHGSWIFLLILVIFSEQWLEYIYLFIEVPACRGSDWCVLGWQSCHWRRSTRPGVRPPWWGSCSPDPCWEVLRSANPLGCGFGLPWDSTWLERAGSKIWNNSICVSRCPFNVSMVNFDSPPTMTLTCRVDSLAHLIPIMSGDPLHTATHSLG